MLPPATGRMEVDDRAWSSLLLRQTVDGRARRPQNQPVCGICPWRFCGRDRLIGADALGSVHVHLNLIG